MAGLSVCWGLYIFMGTKQPFVPPTIRARVSPLLLTKDLLSYHIGPVHDGGHRRMDDTLSTKDVEEEHHLQT